MAGVDAANCARAACSASTAIWCSTAAPSACRMHDAAAFDNEPLRPYNVGPDAMLVNFKAVRFAFSPNASDDGVDVKVEPALPQVALGFGAGARRRPLRRLATTAPAPRSSASRAQPRPAFPVPTLDPAAFATGMSRCWTIRRTCTGCSSRTSPKRAAHFGGAVRDGRAPPGAGRSPCSNRPRSTTSCATSTSFRTTSWHASCFSRWPRPPRRCRRRPTKPPTRSTAGLRSAS